MTPIHIEFDLPLLAMSILTFVVGLVGGFKWGRRAGQRRNWRPRDRRGKFTSRED